MGLVAAVLAAGCGGLRSTAAPGRVALVIGNAAYRVVTPLSNPVNDAADMCERLKTLGFKTMCFTNLPTPAEFERHVAAFIDALPANGEGVFFYSGHGVQAAGNNYLVPVDAGAGLAGEAALQSLYGLDHLFAALRQRPGAFKMVVLDACRSDPFSLPAEPAAALRAAAATRSAFVRNLQVVGKASYGSASISDAPKGTLVLYATASRDTAFDGDGRNGPLTKHLLSNISVRDLPVEELVKRVIGGVEEETRRKFGKPQTPYQYSSFEQRFCFAGCIDTRTLRSLPPTN